MLYLAHLGKILSRGLRDARRDLANQQLDKLYMGG